MLWSSRAQAVTRPHPQRAGLLRALDGIACEHVVTRSVRDTAAILDLEWPPAVGDPYFAPPPSRPYLSEVGSDPGRLHVGLTTRPLGGGPIDEACVKAAEDAAKLLADLGHAVELAAPSFNHDRMFDAWNKIFQANEAWALDGAAKVLGRVPSRENVEANNLYLLELGRKVTGADLINAINAVHAETRRFAEFFSKYDLWLTPTLGTVPPRLGPLFADGDPQIFRATEGVHPVYADLQLYRAPRRHPAAFLVGGSPSRRRPSRWSLCR